MDKISKSVIKMDYVKRLGIGGFATVMLNSQGDAVKISQNDELFIPGKETLTEIAITNLPSGEGKSYFIRNKGYIVGEKDTLIILPLAEMNLFQYAPILPIGEKKKVIYQIALGLAELHNLGIVHMDIKPQNILLMKQGGEMTPLIADFGLSNWYCYVVINYRGTYWFSAPEVLRKTNITTTADVWSLGVLIYWLITGQYLFTGDTPEHVLTMIKQRGLYGKAHPGYTSIKEKLNQLNDPPLVDLLTRMITKANTRLDIFQVIQDSYFDEVRADVELPTTLANINSCSDLELQDSNNHIYPNAATYWKNNRGKVLRKIFGPEAAHNIINDYPIIGLVTTVDIFDRYIQHIPTAELINFGLVAICYVMQMISNDGIAGLPIEHYKHFIETTNLNFQPYTFLSREDSNKAIRTKLGLQVLEVVSNVDYPIWSYQERRLHLDDLINRDKLLV